jgi:hypothetical protein
VGFGEDTEGDSHLAKKAQVTPSVINQKEKLPKLSYEDISNSDKGCIHCQIL